MSGQDTANLGDLSPASTNPSPVGVPEAHTGSWRPLTATWLKLVARFRANWGIPSRFELDSALDRAREESERAERAYMVSSVAGERLRQAEQELAELRLELAGERGRRAQAETVAEDAQAALRGEIEKRLKLEEERERKKKSRPAPAPAPVRVLSPAISRNASMAQIDKKRRDAS